ncbi:MAG TPA: sigma-70 family RNA polymerase sigma factor [Isosphaeraceae bacterium]|jgi:RNA polymerase sigma-70 factor (ECF subfamily)
MNYEDDGQVPPLDRFREFLRRRVARKKLSPAARARIDPSDVIQQTFVDAYRSPEQFRGQSESRLRVCLARMLDNNVIDALRALGRAKRKVASERPLVGDLEQPSARSSPRASAERNERARRVAAALQRLPEPQRRALELMLQGWSQAEIGRQLGLSRNAVAGLIRRGYAALRGLLQDE